MMTTTTPLRILVAINPAASFGSSVDVGPLVVAGLRDSGHTVTDLLEGTAHDLAGAVARELAAAEADGVQPDALVVVGGDGMVSLAVNALAGTGIPLGIIACGTGNDTARGLGLPVGNPAAALAALLVALRHPPRVIDAVRVTRADASTMWFAGVLSAGFDAIVNERANSLRYPRGKSRYTLALLIELVRLRAVRYRLVFDGVELAESAMLVSAGNGVSIGGGMRVTPNALLDDGLLDVLVVRPLSRLSFLRIFPRVFAGTHLTDPRVSVHRAARVRIEETGTRDVVAYADGERVGRLPLDLEVVPGALRVLVN